MTKTHFFALGELILAQKTESPVDRVAMAKIAERLSEEDLSSGREWIETIPADREAPARAAYSRAIIERHPDTAKTWANSVENPYLRAVLLREIRGRP